MKKISILLVIFALLPIIAFSQTRKKTIDNQDNILIGSWQLDSIGLGASKLSPQSVQKMKEKLFQTTYTFGADGSFENKVENKIDGGKWLLSVNKDTLTLIYKDKTIVNAVNTLTDKDLIITPIINGSAKSGSVFMKRKEQ